MEVAHQRKMMPLACYEFGNKIRKGDIVITKKGSNSYVGWGIVTSDYYFKGDHQI